jgi:hypothetical protein
MTNQRLVLAVAALIPSMALAQPAPVAAQSRESVDVLLRCFESGRRDDETCLGDHPGVHVYLTARADLAPGVLDHLLDGLERIALTGEDRPSHDALGAIATFGFQRRNSVPVLERLRRVYASSSSRSLRFSVLHYAALQTDSAGKAEFFGEVTTHADSAEQTYGRTIPRDAVQRLISMSARGEPELERLHASGAVTDTAARELLSDYFLEPGEIDWRAARECFSAMVHRGRDSCSTYHFPRAKSLRDYLGAERYNLDVVHRSLDELVDLAIRLPDPLVRRAALVTVSARGDARSADVVWTLPYLQRIYEETSLPEVRYYALQHVPHRPPREAARFLFRIATGEFAPDSAHGVPGASTAIDGLSRLGEPGRETLARLREGSAPGRDVRNRLQELEENDWEPVDDTLRVARICFETGREGACAPGIPSLERIVYSGVDTHTDLTRRALDALAEVVIRHWDSNVRIRAFVILVMHGPRTDEGEAGLLRRLGWIASSSENRFLRSSAIDRAASVKDTAALATFLEGIASGPPDLEATGSVEGSNSVPLHALGGLAALGEPGHAVLRRLAETDAVDDPHGRAALPRLIERLDAARDEPLRDPP